ncbi:arylsulfatase [Flavivirga amylovorans]|uniref:Arylsulfatase n=1 Tax=Flavivirga amylovorans TaxID=870486 RepID=A0ABT8WX21_9FLAO|nr:arylsulfatase [Flavivirga amylovorans]MDO5986210.1 arylsulfatase [Flavivirga amylovorans]
MDIKILYILTFLLFVSKNVVGQHPKEQKPNIIYILADDMGLGDVSGINPEGKIKTPHIDRMIHEGMNFMDAHTSSSVCSPTRYGIMTGRYAWRTILKEGVLGGHSKPLIPKDRTTVASFLKKQGYNTVCVGKWHLGMDWTNNAPEKSKRITAKYVTNPYQTVNNTALDAGFDYYFGISGSLNMDPHAYMENRNLIGTLSFVKDKSEMNRRSLEDGRAGWVSEGFTRTKVLTDLAHKTSEWITKNHQKPFFVYLPLTSPHSPIVPREEFQGKSGLNPHGDFVMETDWVVGEVLKTLDKLKISDNTIIIFTTDNGTSPKAKIEEMKQKGHYTSWKYRGCKGTTWEGGHRVPFIVRWPQKIKPNTECHQTICTTDLLATCAEILNKKLLGNQGEDSVSFLPALEAKEIPNNAERLIVHHSDKGVYAVRKGKWKLLLDNKGGSNRGKVEQITRPITNMSDLLLFDMETDETETTNLSLQYPEIVEDLKKELAIIIENGRSTKGEVQKNDPYPSAIKWHQIDLLRPYMKDKQLPFEGTYGKRL